MTATLGRLLALADAPRPRAALAAALGALTVILGAGLMATAGYLISRASERPAILSLTVAIVGVRFFGLSRPLTRYLERLASHDLALRVLGRVRVQRLPARSSRWRRRSSRATATATCWRAWSPTSTRCRTCTCAPSARRSSALLAGAVLVGVAAAFLPAAGLVLAVGLVAGGVAVPALAGWLGRRGGRRQAAARGELSAELVEVLRARAGARRLRRRGRARRRACAPPTARSSGSRAATPSSAASPMAPGSPSSARRWRACSPWPCARPPTGTWTATLIAMLALLALASFEAVQPLAAAARELSVTLAAGGRVLELADREAAVVDPVAPLPAPSWPFAVALEDVRARYAPGERAALDGVSLRLEPGCRVALVGPSGAGKTTVVNLLLRFLDPEAGRVTLAGRDLREYRQEDVRRAIAVAGQDSHLFSASIRENVCLARPGASDDDVEAALRAGAAVVVGRRAARTGWTPPWGRRGASSRAASASGSSSPGRCSWMLPCWCSTSPRRTSIRPPPARSSTTSSPPPAIARCCSSRTVAEGLDLVEEIIRIG